MNYIIVTSYNEPKATEKAISCILEQIEEGFKVVVSDPFIEVHEYLKSKFQDKRIEYFLDPDEGKSTALNIILSNIYKEDKEEVIIFTDGDVFLESNSIKEVLEHFKDGNVGVVCGHPVPLNERNNKFGFWAHFQFHVMNGLRKRLSKEDFFEASGYLFAIRNGVIKEFPTYSSEDSIIPYLFYQKSYKVKYAENALVYVLNPQNFKDWILQRKRNIKGHSGIKKDIENINAKRTKTFSNEIKNGLLLSLVYPKNVKEYYWMLQFYFARLYVWLLAYYEMKFKKKVYKDGWRVEDINSTKPFD